MCTTLGLNELIMAYGLTQMVNILQTLNAFSRKIFLIFWFKIHSIWFPWFIFYNVSVLIQLMVWRRLEATPLLGPTVSRFSDAYRSNSRILFDRFRRKTPPYKRISTQKITNTFKYTYTWNIVLVWQAQLLTIHANSVDVLVQAYHVTRLHTKQTRENFRIIHKFHIFINKPPHESLAPERWGSSFRIKSRDLARCP